MLPQILHQIWVAANDERSLALRGMIEYQFWRKVSILAKEFANSPKM